MEADLGDLDLDLIWQREMTARPIPSARSPQSGA